MLILTAPLLFDFSIVFIVMLTINFIVGFYSAKRSGNKIGWRTPIIVALIQSIVIILLDTLLSLPR